MKGKQVSLTIKREAVQEDCERAVIMVAPMDIFVPCRAPKLLFDRGALWEKGAAAIRISDGRLIVRTASERRGVRPWAPTRRRREAVSPDPEAEGGKQGEERVVNRTSGGRSGVGSGQLAASRP